MTELKGRVTFEYKDSKDKRWEKCTLPGTEFLRRFLQHVLPRGFHKVRYYGLLGPRNRFHLRRLQLILSAKEQGSISATEPAPAQNEAEKACPCPLCEGGIMLVISVLPRAARGPP